MRSVPVDETQRKVKDSKRGSEPSGQSDLLIDWLLVSETSSKTGCQFSKETLFAGLDSTQELKERDFGAKNRKCLGLGLYLYTGFNLFCILDSLAEY